MRRFEMDIFEEMDAIIDDFFTSLDNTITYDEPEEEDEEEEEEENPFELTEEEEIAYNKYDDERGAWELWEQANAYSLFLFQHFTALKCKSEL